jgi:tRNA A37 N6-isopentenylltransferase MiaA
VTKEIPLEIQQLLHQYADIFADKVSYPPTRACNHSIPLVSGARPVVVRPYRYAPALKDEIEAQVAEMLQAGLIQHSQSPFSSPIILVKKKNSSYRFCIDYRHLNAIIEKGQYPVPVIDELLDELHQAHWFSSLDFVCWISPYSNGSCRLL